VSKERARRRAEREAARAARIAAGERRRSRAARRRALLPGVPRLPPSRGRPEGRLRQRRRAQNGVVVVLFLLVQVVAWLLTSDWWLRLAVLVVSVLALPVLVTLVLDRRGVRGA